MFAKALRENQRSLEKMEREAIIQRAAMEKELSKQNEKIMAMGNRIITILGSLIVIMGSVSAFAHHIV